MLRGTGASADSRGPGLTEATAGGDAVSGRDEHVRFPDPLHAPDDQELLAVGTSLGIDLVLAGYRAGLFPMPFGVPGSTALRGQARIGWWSPNPRGILPPGGLRVTRSLRRSVGRFRYSIDTAFETVVRGCANPERPHGWIDVAMLDLYLRLHESGFAHSIEVWQPGRDELAGGLFGVEIGGLFAAESMFHRCTDSSKAAVVELVSQLAGTSDEHLIDVQWLTPHLASLGAVAVPRPRYVELLDEALTLEPAFNRTR